MRRSRKSSPLPVRGGVSPHAVFLPPGPWPTVLAFLCERFPAVGEARWRQRMSDGDVADSQGGTLRPGAPYRAGSRIHYYRSLEQEIPVPFTETILYQDDHLLVADKPHFLATQPSGPFLQETLVARLRRRLGNDQLEPLHRLDRETAGLVLLSTSRQHRDRYHALFRDQQVTKVYQAIAPVRQDLVFPLTRRSRIGADTAFHRRCETAGEANAQTWIERLAVAGAWGRYRLLPATGKTHQLRVHMAALGIPIRHDPLYPVDQSRDLADFSTPLQLLAAELVFVDPVTGEARHFRSQLSLALPGLD